MMWNGNMNGNGNLKHCILQQQSLSGVTQYKWFQNLSCYVAVFLFYVYYVFIVFVIEMVYVYDKDMEME